MFAVNSNIAGLRLPSGTDYSAIKRKNTGSTYPLTNVKVCGA